MVERFKKNWAIAEIRSEYVMLAIFVLSIFIPLAATKYSLTLFSKVLLFCLCAWANILLSNYGGMASFAHISFYGISAYTVAILTTMHDWTFWPAVLIAMLFSFIAAVIYGLVSVRASGRYFFQISIAFLQLIYLTVRQWPELTKGTIGIVNIPAAPFLGTTLTDKKLVFYFTLAVVVLCYLLLKSIVTAPFGLALTGIRDNQAKMNALGFNVKFQRLVAIVIAEMIAAIGGILWVIINRVITSENISANWATIVMFMCILGGTKKFEGGVLGALIYVFMSDYLGSVTRRTKLIIGLMYIALVMFMPDGILCTNYKAAVTEFKEKRRKKKAALAAAKDDSAAKHQS